MRSRADTRRFLWRACAILAPCLFLLMAGSSRVARAEDAVDARPASEMRELLNEAFKSFENGEGREARWRFARVEPRWQAFLKTNPRFWDKRVFYQLAVCYYNIGQYDIAKSTIRKLLIGSAHPRPEAVGYHILAIYKTGDFEGATARGRRLKFHLWPFKNQEITPQVMFAVANSYLHLGFLSDATAMFEEMKGSYEHTEWDLKARGGLRLCEAAKHLLKGSPQSAREAMDYFAGTNAWDMFLLALKHENPAVKKEAAKRLGNVTGRENLPSLLLALRRLRVVKETEQVSPFHKEFTEAVVRSLANITGLVVPDMVVQSANSIQAAIDVYATQGSPSDMPEVKDTTEPSAQPTPNGMPRAAEVRPPSRGNVWSYLLVGLGAGFAVVAAAVWLLRRRRAA